MTQPVELISWRAGKKWAGWHVSVEGIDGDPVCKTPIPDNAPRCAASRGSARVLLEEICKRCLERYSDTTSEVGAHQQATKEEGV